MSLRTDIFAEGTNVYIEPTFGSIENPRSIIAATKASHRTGLRAADDLENSDEKTSAVEVLTSKVSFD
jgi:hypothetical protein